MSTDYTSEGAVAAPSVNSTGRIMAILTMVAGVILIVAGGVTWFTVTDQLKAEAITVPEDAACAAGNEVAGPISAYCMADIINTHALKTTNGQTYAQLARDDPARTTAMTSSFLRSSLFTSVVSYGVAAMAMGLGLVCIFIGIGLNAVSKR